MKQHANAMPICHAKFRHTAVVITSRYTGTVMTCGSHMSDSRRRQRLALVSCHSAVHRRRRRRGCHAPLLSSSEVAARLPTVASRSIHPTSQHSVIQVALARHRLLTVSLSQRSVCHGPVNCSGPFVRLQRWSGKQYSRAKIRQLVS